MDILKSIEGKEPDEIDDIIASNLLSKDFYLEIEKLMTTSFDYFMPIIRVNLENLLKELMVEDEVVDYHIVLENRGFERVKEREELINDSEDYSDELKNLDLELADRILKIGDVIKSFN